ncbi:MAG: DUF1592 domain-containing protein [Myxococcota bacterium]|nr:DUF1592 domain-containing protein [Myxococcota bacterium]
MRSTRRALSMWVAVLLASASTACTGHIIDGPARGGREGVPGVVEPIACNEGRVLPGWVGTRRLNRTELNHTLRDLLGETGHPADALPTDVALDGFDTVAEGLSTSPEHARIWWDVTEALVRDALGRSSGGAEAMRREAETSADVYCTDRSAAGFANLCSETTLGFDFVVPVGGAWRVVVRAYGEQAGDEAVQMALRVDGTDVRVFEVTATAAAPVEHTIEVALGAGSHRVEVAFLNDLWDDTVTPIVNRDLQVDWFELSPATSGAPSIGRDDLVTCEPAAGDSGEACAREVLSAFGERAWRRPLDGDELGSLVELVMGEVAAGTGFDAAIAHGLRAVLLSPSFLFRVEADGSTAPGTVVQVSAWEMASRLSYALWSTMPDEELFALAESGDLLAPDVLEAQVVRMLDDDRARALGERFAGQWLGTAGLASLERDAPGYAELATSMEAETLTFFDSFLREDKSVRELLSADYAFVDERLAAHYDLPGVVGPELRRVPTGGARPGGVLGLGSVLTATSHASSTSVVLRGEFVLASLLCQPPPPPPADAESLNAMLVDGTASSRVQSEQRRASAVCASCHAAMDPIGLAFEGFDSVGAPRGTDDNGYPLELAGSIAGIGEFETPDELAATLSDDPRFRQCFAEKLFTFMVGRAPGRDDDCAVDHVIASAEPNGERLVDYVSGVVLSDAFRMRQVEGGER